MVTLNPSHSLMEKDRVRVAPKGHNPSFLGNRVNRYNITLCCQCSFKRPFPIVQEFNLSHHAW